MTHFMFDFQIIKQYLCFVHDLLCGTVQNRRWNVNIWLKELICASCRQFVCI